MSEPDNRECIITTITHIPTRRRELIIIDRDVGQANFHHQMKRGKQLAEDFGLKAVAGNIWQSELLYLVTEVAEVDMNSTWWREYDRKFWDGFKRAKPYAGEIILKFEVEKKDANIQSE